MALNVSSKKLFGQAAGSVFDAFMSDTDKLCITTEGGFDPQNYSDTKGKSYIVRGIIVKVAVNKIDGENIKTGDCKALILADELPVIPEVGMLVEDAPTSPKTTISDGRQYRVYGIETDAANAVHTFYMRRV